MGWQIAIDGPAASGKSTVARRLAQLLHFEYLDTGAMYRAVALKAMNQGINLDNEDVQIPSSMFSFLENTEIDFVSGRLLLDGVDVSDKIRNQEMSNKASFVSRNGYVREILVSMQQKMANNRNIILDGRDIGTVVLPNANLKIFLYADSKVRAVRRMKEREALGVFISYEETIKEIETRDYKDSHREISPLTQADDAVFLDTSELSVEQVIEEITRLVLKRGYSMENLENLEQKNIETAETEEQEVTASEALVEEEQEEKKVGYKEMQVVEGTVVEVQEAQEERKMGNKVLKAREERVLIALEDGQEGFLFRKDCANIDKDEALFDQFVEGDQVKVAIKKIFPDGGKFIFSTILVEKHDKLVEFEKTIKDKPIIVAKVIKQVADFGLLMKYEDFTCLLPTQLATAPKEEFESLVGKDLEVCPIRIDLSRIRIIVSQAHAEKKKQKAAKKEFISQIEVGQVYEGKVKNVEDYGAFVEIYEGVEGLLHISEVDHNRVSKVEKVLNVGDTVQVQVIKVEKDHIGLSRKALLPNHWANYFAEKQIGDIVTGKAIEINKAGIRLELATELEGFVPKSEFSWERNVQVEDLVKVGDEVTGKLIEVEKSKRRIIISVKQLNTNPWAETNVENGAVIDVNVLEVTQDGYKVEYAGLNGFMSKGAVRLSEQENVQAGSTVKVKVRVFDQAKQRFIVSMRDAEEKVEKESFRQYTKGNDTMTNTFGDYLTDLKKRK